MEHRLLLLTCLLIIGLWSRERLMTDLDRSRRSRCFTWLVLFFSACSFSFALADLVIGITLVSWIVTGIVGIGCISLASLDSAWSILDVPPGRRYCKKTYREAQRIGLVQREE